MEEKAFDEENQLEIKLKNLGYQVHILYQTIVDTGHSINFENILIDDKILVDDIHSLEILHNLFNELHQCQPVSEPNLIFKRSLSKYFQNIFFTIIVGEKYTGLKCCHCEEENEFIIKLKYCICDEKNNFCCSCFEELIEEKSEDCSECQGYYYSDFFTSYFER